MGGRHWPINAAERAEHLYEIGLSTESISAQVTQSPDRVKVRITKSGWRRDPALFPEALRLIALPGERFALVDGSTTYFISDHGRLINFPLCVASPEMSYEIADFGYRRVVLFIGKRLVHHYIHVLVATHFCPGKESGLIVAHWDGSRTNNHHTNLRWTTHKGNSDDMLRHGTRLLGSRHPRSKISEDDVRRVRAVLSGLNEVHGCVRMAAKITGIKYATILDIRCGRSWGHVK